MKKTAKVQAMIGLATAAVVLLGYFGDAANYYETSSNAAAERSSIMSWSELESIKHKIEVLKLKIQRITDRAVSQSRGLTLDEAEEIAFMREEIRLHNDRRNAILAGSK